MKIKKSLNTTELLTCWQHVVTCCDIKLEHQVEERIHQIKETKKVSEKTKKKKNENFKTKNLTMWKI